MSLKMYIFVILLLTFTIVISLEKPSRKRRKVINLKCFPSSSKKINYGICLEFDLSPIPSHGCIREADLYVYQKKLFNYYNDDIHDEELYFLMVFRKSKSWFNTEKISYLAQKQLNVSYEGWWKIDIAYYVYNWFKKKEFQQVLCLVLTNGDEQTLIPELFGIMGFPNFEVYQPYIKVYVTGLDEYWD